MVQRVKPWTRWRGQLSASMSGSGTSSVPASGFTPESGFSVSGDFVDGGEITITRSSGSFGTKDHQATFLFDDFESYTTDAVLSSPWTVDSATNQPVITTAKAFSGSKSLRVNMNHAENSNGAPRLINIDSLEVYASRRLYWEEYAPQPDDGAGANLKFFRFSSDNNLHEPSPHLSGGMDGPVGGLLTTGVVGQAGDGTAHGWFGPTLPEDAWVRDEGWLRLSTSSTGKRFFKLNGVGDFTYSGVPGGHVASPSGTYANTAYQADSLQTTDNGAALIKAYWITWFKRGWQRLEMWVDEIYIDKGTNAQARIEVGQASFGTDSRVRYPCPYSAWATGSITVNINAAGQSPSGKGLFFVSGEGVVEKIGEFD